MSTQNEEVEEPYKEIPSKILSHRSKARIDRKTTLWMNEMKREGFQAEKIPTSQLRYE